MLEKKLAYREEVCVCVWGREIERESERATIIPSLLIKIISLYSELKLTLWIRQRRFAYSQKASRRPSYGQQLYFIVRNCINLYHYFPSPLLVSFSSYNSYGGARFLRTYVTKLPAKGNSGKFCSFFFLIELFLAKIGNRWRSINVSIMIRI